MSAAPASRRWRRRRATPSRCTPMRSTRRCALPTDFSARIARNTQIVLQQESGTTRIADPWGGSFYVERLTQELMQKAWGHIQEVEELGGMAKAIEAGIPKLRIEEASAKTQARIDGGQQSVIGVNKYRPESEAPIDVLKVDNSAVLKMQLDKLARLRRERDPAQLAAALESLTRAAERRQRQSPGARGRRRPRQGHRRRNLKRAGEGVGPPPRRDQIDHRRVQAGGWHDRGRRAGAEAGRGVRGERRPPAAHPGRQDRPGRPRPRPEGDRLGVRGPGLRRRHRAAVRDARAKPRGRRSRTTCISSACRRSPPRI